MEEPEGQGIDLAGTVGTPRTSNEVALRFFRSISLRGTGKPTKIVYPGDESFLTI
jgi:hypothetical protein